jgi:Na+/melibiose symporter-like transporter
MIIGDAEADGVVLTVWVFHEGKQFAFAYKLFSSVDRHKRLTEMMLELVRVAKKAKKNEQEVVDLRHQLRKNRVSFFILILFFLFFCSSCCPCCSCFFISWLFPLCWLLLWYCLFILSPFRRNKRKKKKPHCLHGN